MRFSRGGGDDIAVVEGARVDATSDETRNVSHIAHQEGAMLVSDTTEGLVVPVTRVCGGTTDDEAGLVDAGLLCEGCVVDVLGLCVEAVGEGLEVDGGGCDFLFGGL